MPKLIPGDVLIEEGMIMGDRGDFWLTVLEAIPEAVLVINLVDRSVKQANYLFGKLWGCDEYEQLTAEYTLADILANPSEQEQLINQVLCQGYLPEFPILGKKFDGTPVWWEISCRLMTGEPALGILLVRQLNFTENSSDDQATNKLSTIQSRICQQAAVAYLGQIALHSDDLLDLWDKAVALVNGTLQTKYAAILELLPNGQAFLMRAGRGWQNGIAGYATISARSYSQAGYTLQVNQSVVVEDLPIETRFSGEPLLHNHRVISGVSVVISCQTPFNTHLTDLVTSDIFALSAEADIENNYPAWGILSVHTDKPRHFTQQEVYFLEAIAHLLASAIERQNIHERLQLLERVLNSSSNGIIITDAARPDNPVIFVNPAFEKMTGYSAQETLGKNCRFLQGGDRHQPALAQLRSAVLLGKSCHIVVRNYRKDGSLFWNELSVSPVYNNLNHLTHFIGIQTDITQRKHSEEEILIKSHALTVFSANLKQLHWVATRDHQTLEELFTDYLHTGIEILGLENAIISRITAENYYIEAVQSNLGLNPGEVFPVSDTYCSAVVREKRTITYRQIGIEAGMQNHPVYVNLHLESYIGTPIWVNGQIYGTLNFSSIHPRYNDFVSYEQELIELMAQGIGRFLAMSEKEAERQQAIRDLQQSEERYRSLVEMSPSAIALHCQGNLVYVNAATLELLGAKHMDEIVAQPILNFVHPDYVELARQRILQVERDGKSTELMDEKLVRLDGQVIDVEIVGIPAVYQSQIATQLVIRDVTEQKRAQEKLLHDALHDNLTGLPNRALFYDRLGQSLRRSRQYADYQFAVLFLDLDRFKIVNDSLGHTIGDKLLIMLADRLSNNLSPSDTVSRLGGDEFTILLEYLPHADYAIDIAKGIHQQLSLPFMIEGREIFTTASIGIVYSQGYPPKPDQLRQAGKGSIYQHPEDLLRHADIAMYRAKALGKARHEVFDMTMQAQTMSELEMETELRRAIEMLKNYRQAPENCQFVLYYQPIVSLQTGKIRGFEALIRWSHPLMGLVPPNKFIPLAEETGLIIPLGMWVLHTACVQLNIWQEMFCCDRENHSAADCLTMSINLSGKQLTQPDLINEINNILQETGCPADCVKLEITESILMENVGLANRILGQLKDLNFKLSLDDFGTGYSSLSYLHRFPIDVLKIDRSFVSRLGINQDGKISDHLGESVDKDLQIVSAIIALAHSLNLQVIAEGIELLPQARILQKMFCQFGQGYLFAKAVPSEEATALLKDFCFDFQPKV